MKKKILLASGCSFTAPRIEDDDYNWPEHLCKKLDIDLINVGMSSQGNGLISRKVIYNVEQLLKKYENSEILVGVMWSGVDRYDYYSNSNEDVKTWGSFPPDIPLIKNPTNIVENSYHWRIINHNWKNNEAKLYYENFYTDIFSTIMTIEHILRVQWYLDKYNISYFMTTYMNIFDSKINTNEIKYLYNLINFEKFLPVNGCYEWTKENYAKTGFKNRHDLHPTSFAHEKFSNEIIIPYLLKNNII